MNSQNNNSLSREELERAQKRNKFLKSALELYGTDKYDYSQVDFKNSKSQVKIKCLKHNLTFLETPERHLMHHTGCPECKNDKREMMNM